MKKNIIIVILSVLILILMAFSVFLMIDNLIVNEFICVRDLNSSDPRVRYSVMNDFGLMIDQVHERSLKYLHEGLKDPSPDVRAAAINPIMSLRKIDPLTIELLIDLLDDPDQVVRDRALLVLGYYPEHHIKTYSSLEYKDITAKHKTAEEKYKTGKQNATDPLNTPTIP